MKEPELRKPFGLRLAAMDCATVLAACSRRGNALKAVSLLSDHQAAAGECGAAPGAVLEEL